MEDRKDNEKIVVTGGGSGGHTMTAMAVVDELLRRNSQLKQRIVYIGGSLAMEGEGEKKSLEEKVAKERGLQFVKIRSGKLQRQFSLRTIKLLFGVIGGLVDAWRFFRSNNVSLVFSSGGYVTVPVCFVAGLRKIPVIIHEQTTRVGLANSLSSRFAREVLIAFEESRRFFKRRKVTFVGNTIREIFRDPWSEENCPATIREKLEGFKSRKDNYPVVLISGGGQGSILINQNVDMALKNLLSKFQVILITGDNRVAKDYDRIERNIKKLSKDSQDRIILTKFAGPEIGAYFDVADLFVGRSGAMFMHEVGVTKTPAVLIPIPWVTHNEQYHNAKVLEDLGLAVILPQGELNPEILVQKIACMIEKIRNGKLKVDKERIEKVFVTDAAERIADILEKYL